MRCVYEHTHHHIIKFRAIVNIKLVSKPWQLTNQSEQIFFSLLGAAVLRLQLIRKLDIWNFIVVIICEIATKTHTCNRQSNYNYWYEADARCTPQKMFHPNNSVKSIAFTDRN